MICQKCGFDFKEHEIEESHNVPCYLFKGETRNIKKNCSDKFGRRWLCKKCHSIYENNVLSWIMSDLPYELREAMIKSAYKFSQIYFPKKQEVY